MKNTVESPCGLCNGIGCVPVFDDERDEVTDIECPQCRGKGYMIDHRIPSDEGMRVGISR